MNAQTLYSPKLSDSVRLDSDISLGLIQQKLNVIRHAVQAVKKQTGRASNNDVATYLGVTLDEYIHILQDANTRIFHNFKQEVA